LTGYEAFCLYTGLKLHFTSSYDFFKYNGKVRVTVDAFDNRKDKYYFHRIARKYNKEEFTDFLVANFLDNPGVWIGKLLDEEANERYVQYQKNMQSLSYIFEEDCRHLFDSLDNPNDILKTNGEHPVLLKKAFRGEVSIQTVYILNQILNFVPVWKQKIVDTIVWSNYENKLNKYSGFIRIDLMKYKLILKKSLP
jgi:hypothetical protein